MTKSVEQEAFNQAALAGRSIVKNLIAGVLSEFVAAGDELGVGANAAVRRRSSETKVLMLEALQARREAATKLLKSSPSQALKDHFAGELEMIAAEEQAIIGPTVKAIAAPVEAPPPAEKPTTKIEREPRIAPKAIADPKAAEDAKAAPPKKVATPKKKGA